MCSEELAASSLGIFQVSDLETITELNITVLDNFESILNLAVTCGFFQQIKNRYRERIVLKHNSL